MALNLRVVYSGSVGSILKFFDSIKPNETVLVLDGRRSTYISEEGANAQVKKRGSQVVLDWILNKPEAVRFFAQHFALASSVRSVTREDVAFYSNVYDYLQLSALASEASRNKGKVFCLDGIDGINLDPSDDVMVFADPKFIVR